MYEYAGDLQEEICVFVGTEPQYFVNKTSGINVEGLCYQRGALGRIGAPYDLFSMSDLKRVDASKYKLFIFLDAYSLLDDERDYINGTLKGDGRSLWFVGPCDYIGEDGVSRKRMFALCEMEIDLLEKDEAQIRAFNSQYGYGDAKKPTPYVSADDVRVLGRFSGSRKCALAVREKENYNVFFSALGKLSHETLRGVAKMAGVHIYVEEGVFTYINDTVAGVYNTNAATTELTLPADGEYKELFSGKIYKTQNKKVVLPTDECPVQMLVLK